MKKITTYFFVIAVLLITGCAGSRNLVYFSNMTNAGASNTNIGGAVIIHQKDILSITVNSLNPESNLLFNGNKNSGLNNPAIRSGYKVNENGFVNLPLIGDYKVEGQTIEEAQIEIAKKLAAFVKSPVVDIQLLNFKISVIGEVNRPSTFTITDENVNLLEALGMAGDMTVYGKRNNVLVIRTENGRRTMNRLDLNKIESMDSPYFNLKQNDIVYVEPDKSKAVEFSQNTRLAPIVVASISALAVLAAVLFKR
ncbi:polysaccharide biosynthesis/export family protein [Mucilaginibacter sp. SMC90]|uniref:polysaccharide biosynthesis/export family protein n=1 Tax=Mucilaginibacter sp. SMC90 TaxID=2929803 RepID=UPI001FB2E2E6|nr:polysaccharide biosynthesis/export family protein [Mucilaginibacter sp. SMC90]UOE51696.1 polysaccharide biosynthesis/export family protein [Mucilaginibacter sp. SMC90]